MNEYKKFLKTGIPILILFFIISLFIVFQSNFVRALINGNTLIVEGTVIDIKVNTYINSRPGKDKGKEIKTCYPSVQYLFEGHKKIFISTETDCYINIGDKMKLIIDLKNPENVASLFSVIFTMFFPLIPIIFLIILLGFKKILYKKELKEDRFINKT